MSCESRSACDLLGWHSVRVEEETFLAGLPRSDNPEEGFVGDVDGPAGRLPPEGYGVYEEPIAARLRAFGVPARAVRGRDLAWLRDQLARGRPVIVWATAMLDAPPAVRLQDGRGRAFPAVAYEHTFLAVGYDRATLLLLDSGTGEEERVSAERFDASWAVLGRRAVVVEADRGARGGARVGDGCGARRRE